MFGCFCRLFSDGQKRFHWYMPSNLYAVPTWAVSCPFVSVRLCKCEANVIYVQRVCMCTSSHLEKTHTDIHTHLQIHQKAYTIWDAVRMAKLPVFGVFGSAIVYLGSLTRSVRSAALCITFLGSAQFSDVGVVPVRFGRPERVLLNWTHR